VKAPENLAKMYGKAKTIKINDEGNLIAVDESYAQKTLSQGSPAKRHCSDGASCSSQQSQHSIYSQPCTPSSSGSSSSFIGSISPSDKSGLHLRVDFSNENPLCRSKIENMLTMMHMHLNGALKNDVKVSNASLSCSNLIPFLQILKISTK
jgi:hypothetical protein